MRRRAAPSGTCRETGTKADGLAVAHLDARGRTPSPSARSSVHDAIGELDPEPTSTDIHAKNQQAAAGLRVDSSRHRRRIAVAAGNSPHTYNEAIAPGGVIKAEHVQELASYLFADRFFMSNIDFFYQTESTTVGLPVKALHIQELREGVK